MLRKAKETKLRLIQENNRRLMNEGTKLTPSLQDYIEMVSGVGEKNAKGNKFEIVSPDGKKVKLYLNGEEIDLVRTVKEMS